MAFGLAVINLNFVQEGEEGGTEGGKRGRGGGKKEEGEVGGRRGKTMNCMQFERINVGHCALRK